MADNATIDIVVIWEQELRAAAAALDHLVKILVSDKPDKDVVKKATCLAIVACDAALHGVHTAAECSIILHSGNPDRFVPRIINVAKGGK